MTTDRHPGTPVESRDPASLPTHNGQVHDTGVAPEYSIIIRETVDSPEALADLLEHIAGQLRDGYTSGFHPGWELTS